MESEEDLAERLIARLPIEEAEACFPSAARPSAREAVELLQRAVRKTRHIKCNIKKGFFEKKSQLGSSRILAR